jgi:hypothetical protein
MMRHIHPQPSFSGAEALTYYGKALREQGDAPYG